jgi:hypothetical protein
MWVNNGDGTGYDDGTGEGSGSNYGSGSVGGYPADTSGLTEAQKAGINAIDTSGYGDSYGSTYNPYASPGTPEPITAAQQAKIDAMPGASDFNWGKLLGMGLAGAQLHNQLNAPGYHAKTPAELMGGIANNTPTYSVAQVAAMQNPLKSGSALQRIYAGAGLPSSRVKGTREYAEGGEVAGPLSSVEGDDPGQSDKNWKAVMRPPIDVNMRSALIGMHPVEQYKLLRQVHGLEP